MKTPVDDYYRILEVHPDASAEVIQKAYRALAQKYHPDQAADPVIGESAMKQLNEAYNILKDPKRRSDYDKTLGRSSSKVKAENAAGPLERLRSRLPRLLTVLAMVGLILVYAKALFLSPVGKILLLVAVCFIYFRWVKPRLNATSNRI